MNNTSLCPRVAGWQTSNIPHLFACFKVFSYLRTLSLKNDDENSSFISVEIPLLICQTMYLSQVLFSFFFLVWNAIIATVIVSVARAQCYKNFYGREKTWHGQTLKPGSAISNGIEPKSYFAWYFNFRIDRFVSHQHCIHAANWQLGPDFALLVC